MDARDTNAALEWVQSDKPPGYLGLFNEPDLSYDDGTPTSEAEEAAKNLTQLINSAPSTQLISPAEAYPGNRWLLEFAGNCTGCFDKIPIIGLHVYDVNPEGAIAQVTSTHDKPKFADKRIWVTELSPSTTGENCDFNQEEEAAWMTTVVTKLKSLDYVERIFWNAGTWVRSPRSVPISCPLKGQGQACVS